MKTAIYARVSQTSEGNDSVANQLKALQEFAKAKGYEVTDTYTDDGISAFKGVERPGFSQLLVDMASKKFERVLVRHSDRLERNPKDAGALHAGCSLHGVTIETLDGHVTDPSTETGGLTATLLSALAYYESQVKSARLRMKYRADREKGTYIPRNSVFGYDGNTIKPDEADLIRKAYVAVDQGCTVGSIVREWNEAGVPRLRGGKRWTYAHLNSILKRHRNAGLMAYKGEILEGVKAQWEPIVDRDLFDRVQAIIRDPARRTSPGFQPIYLSSGIARCGVCGEVMRSNTVSDKRTGTRKKILRCSAVKNGERHASADLVRLDALVFDEVVAAFVFGRKDLFPSSDGDDTGALLKERERLIGEGDVILQDRFDGLVTPAQAREQLTRLKTAREALDARLEASKSAALTMHMQTGLRRAIRTPGRISFDAVSAAHDAVAKQFNALHIEQRRDLVRQLLDIRVHPGRDHGQKYDIHHLVVTGLND